MRTTDTWINVLQTDADRRTALLAGVVFIIATAGSLAAAATLPTLTSEDYLARLSAAAPQAAWGSILYLVAAFGSAGIAVALYPVLRRINPALAIGSIVFRTIEATMYIIGIVALLSLLSVSNQFAGGETTNQGTLQLIADTLRGVRRHASLMGVFAFCLGALAYYVLFFVADLVPRWLSGFGVLAIGLMLVACTLAILSDGDITTYVVFVLPIAVQEMVLALWLIVRGFSGPERREPAGSIQV